jgi:hypothetical protein
MVCAKVINGTSLEFSAVAGYSPDSNNMSTEAEEFPVLRSVTVKQLVKEG